MEIAELEPRAPELEKEIQVLLQPKDPNDDKNVFVEIRAGTGGDEASLFAAEIMRMYIRYAEHEALEGRHHRRELLVGQRHQGRDDPDRGRQGLLAAEVRVGRAPRPARSADRDAGTHPHLGDHRGGAPGSRRTSTSSGQREGPAHRHVLLVRSGRPVGQHDLLGRPHDAHPERRGRVVSGREVADQEPREGAEGPQGAPLRHRAPEARGRALRDAQRHDRQRRPLARRSAPTTSRRTASPTTASA